MDQNRQSGEKRGAGGHMQPYDEHGRYSGPTGGAANLRDGTVRVFTSSGKLAGADSEVGRKEPKSLLSATGEQLRTIASGTGQALRRGAAGAKEALSRTVHELAHNQELHKGLEFGVRAAAEVSKDVGESVLLDTGLNVWDTAGAEATKQLGWEKTARALSNTNLTLPISKFISIKRMADGVFDGGHERDTRDLGRRIADIHDAAYERKR